MLANIAATDLQVLPPEEAARVAAPQLRVCREPAEGAPALGSVFTVYCKMDLIACFARQDQPQHTQTRSTVHQCWLQQVCLQLVLPGGDTSEEVVRPGLHDMQTSVLTARSDTAAQGRDEGDGGPEALPGFQEPGRQPPVLRLRGCDA